MTVPPVVSLLKPWVQRLSVQQVVDLISSDVQEEQENNDLEEEEVSEEDGEEYKPEHDTSSSDEEEIRQAERHFCQRTAK